MRWLAACAVLAATGCAGVATRGGGDAVALDSLLAAERAFARMSVAEGMRAAFIANFADDGIGFQPGPVRIREAFAARPAPANPKAITLDWEPAAAGIARSGDFGFTTGPWVLTDNVGGRPARHGIYFSVWRRAGDGPWRVAIDAGIGTPGPVTADALRPSPGLGPGDGAADAALAALQARERAGVAATGADGYASWFAPDGRLLRDGHAPALGNARVPLLLPPTGARLAFVPEGGAGARSGDLAYSYGAYTVTPADAQLRPGWFVHLWARDGAGAWRLVVAVLREADERP